jgi:hypothetical protein
MQIRERTQSFFVSFLFDIGTFVERLWNVCGRLLLYCFDITIIDSVRNEYFNTFRLIFTILKILQNSNERKSKHNHCKLSETAKRQNNFQLSNTVYQSLFSNKFSNWMR